MSTLLFILLFVLQFATCDKTEDEYRAEGDKFFKENSLDEAIQAYTNAINLNDINYLNYFKRATIYLVKGKNQNALRDLDDVLERKPTFSQARTRRGKLLLELGKYRQSKEDFEELLKLKPDDTLATNNLKLITECESKMKSAETSTADEDTLLYLSQVLEHSPNFIDARLKRAILNMKRNQYNTVLEDTMYVLRNSDNIDALYLRGKAFYYLGQNEAAINHFKEGLKFDPDNSACRTEFKRIKKGEKAVKDATDSFSSGDFEKALDGYNTAIDVFSDSPSLSQLRVSQCKCLVKLQRAQEAVASCTLVIDQDGPVLEALINRGEAQLLLEEFDKAIADFQKASEQQPMNQQVQEGLNRARRLQKMATRKDYYKILGISKQATTSEIRKVYRHLALEWHPDKHNEDKELAEKKFIEISEAYEVLSDEEKRGKYDRGEDIQIEQQHNPFYGGFNPFGGSTFTFHFGRQ